MFLALMMVAVAIALVLGMVLMGGALLDAIKRGAQ